MIKKNSAKTKMIYQRGGNMTLRNKIERKNNCLNSIQPTDNITYQMHKEFQLKIEKEIVTKIKNKIQKAFGNNKYLKIK